MRTTGPADPVAPASQSDARSQLYGFFDPAVVATRGYDVLVPGPARLAHRGRGCRET